MKSFLFSLAFFVNYCYQSVCHGPEPTKMLTSYNGLVSWVLLLLITEHLEQALTCESCSIQSGPK